MPGTTWPPSTSSARFCRTATTWGPRRTSRPHCPTVAVPSRLITRDAAPGRSVPTVRSSLKYPPCASPRRNPELNAATTPVLSAGRGSAGLGRMQPVLQLLGPGDHPGSAVATGPLGEPGSDAVGPGRGQCLADRPAGDDQGDQQHAEHDPADGVFGSGTPPARAARIQLGRQTTTGTGGTYVVSMAGSATAMPTGPTGPASTASAEPTRGGSGVTSRPSSRELIARQASRTGNHAGPLHEAGRVSKAAACWACDACAGCPLDCPRSGPER